MSFAIHNKKTFLSIPHINRSSLIYQLGTCRHFIHTHSNKISSISLENNKNKQLISQWEQDIKEKQLIQKDHIIASPLNLLANTLNEPSIPYKNHILPKQGTIVPATWHHIYFPQRVPESHLAKDGYEADFFPPFPFTKRMWAGATLTWQNNNNQDYLCVGDKATMITYVDRCEFNNSSRLGDTVFVYINKDIYKHHYHDQTELKYQQWIMREQRCLVYATDQAESTAIKSIPVKKKQSQFSIQVNPSPIHLFQYSALTFNAHMIHYNQQYTKSIEHHPACLVHGPLSSTWMISSLRTYLDKEYHYPLDTNIAEFHYKCLSPLYVNQLFTVHGKQSPTNQNQFDLWITNHLHHLSVKGTVLLKKRVN
ncbi:hypothetical protein BJ944DRAFT_171780 [Cunninghamella echinulata]|nr:hypothetical protein BJ944DRAFT_171780 [Cunninghamella echinulata]